MKNITQNIISDTDPNLVTIPCFFSWLSFSRKIPLWILTYCKAQPIVINIHVPTIFIKISILSSIWSLINQFVKIYTLSKFKDYSITISYLQTVEYLIYGTWWPRRVSWSKIHDMGVGWVVCWSLSNNMAITIASCNF